MNSYIRFSMRYSWLIILFVLIAQGSWAFVVSDTLIIDGEIIYVEEKDTPISDSLNLARKSDFKEKKNPIIWGLESSYGVQLTDFFVANGVNQDLVSVNKFTGKSNPKFYHSIVSFGAHVRVHKNIEIGLGFNYSIGDVYEQSANFSSENNTVSFFVDGSQIQRVFETEVQPEVNELDTTALIFQRELFRMRSIQIPLKFRFYVNDFSVKSKWRAYGEISPVYRSFRLSSANQQQMLFLNSNGNYTYLNVGNHEYHQFGVIVGAGAEYHLSKRFGAFTQLNWSFPPINQSVESGAKYYTQYSTINLGLRIIMGTGK